MPKTKSKAKDEPKKPNWRFSDAKQIMAQDMIDSIIPINVKINDTKRLYDELYASNPLFAAFPYDKKLYDTRVERLQKAVLLLKDNAKFDADALAHDRAKYPPQTHNNKGEPLWKGSEAGKCLQNDMDNGLHLQMKPELLRETRECYKLFSKGRFSKRIDQMKQNAKQFGATPGQTKSNNGRVQGRKSESRRGIVENYINNFN